jgi:transcription antitermination factor NusA-like protein
MTKKELAIKIFLKNHYAEREEHGVLMKHDDVRKRNCIVVKEEKLQEAIDFAEDILNSYDKLVGYERKPKDEK